jgi:hypothetical protein
MVAALVACNFHHLASLLSAFYISRVTLFERFPEIRFHLNIWSVSSTKQIELGFIRSDGKVTQPILKYLLMVAIQHNSDWINKHTISL